MNVTLKKAETKPGGWDLKPGEWGRDSDGVVYVRCQHETHVDKRERVGVIHYGKPLPQNWNIDAQGNVTPSIFFNEPNCGWHVFARLEGWAP